MDDNLTWLLKWFASQCDGDWEHGNGFNIGTLDNPGCYVKITLDYTNLSDREFKVIDINRSESDWIYCIVEEGLFKGFGGIYNLPELLGIFRRWAENDGQHN